MQPLLLLYWPDFEPDPVFRPAVVAQLVRRRLCLLHGDFRAYVWDPGEAAGPPYVSGFRRWGLDLVAAPWDPDVAADLVAAHCPSALLVLAMGARRAEDVALRCRAAPEEVEVWSPGREPGSLAAREVLGLDTQHRVALLVAGSLLGPPGSERATAIHALLRLAEMVGLVTHASLHDSGGARDLVDGSEVEPGDLRAAAEALLEAPDAPDTLILVAGGPWVAQLSRRARARGARLLLWHLGDPPPLEARLSADGVADVAWALPAGGGASLPLLPRARVPKADSGPDVEVLPQGYELTSWARLAFAIGRGGEGALSTRTLAVRLAAQGEFGPAEEDARSWLLRAEAHGILTVRETAAGSEIRLVPEHPACRAAREVPERSIRLLARMLRKIPWVSFKLLRSVLIREQWLGAPPYGLTEEGVDAWLNFLIAEGVLQVSREPNRVNPEHPVTALRLAELDPLVRAVVRGLDETAGLVAERVLLAVDHFLIRQHKPWMALSVLRRQLAEVGREELQEVLGALQESGALSFAAYPNPQRDHATTGCSLPPDHPQVAAARAERDRLLRLLAAAPERASELPTPWLALLRAEGLVVERADALHPRADDPVVRAALNGGDG
jgi:hypothetical protein